DARVDTRPDHVPLVFRKRTKHPSPAPSWAAPSSTGARLPSTGLCSLSSMEALSGYELRLCIRLSCPSATRRLGAHECGRPLAHARLGIFADGGDGRLINSGLLEKALRG